jgi:multiple sugar transport system permease protein
MKALRWLVIALGLCFAALPLVWMGLSSLKAREDTIRPHLNFVPVAHAPTDPQSIEFEASGGAYARLSEVHAGARSSFWSHLWSSVVIGVLSTLASVALGTACALGFSRLRIRAEKDWLFFVLSTRFMPPLAVVVPVLLMYRTLDLQGTHLGLALLYTVFNLSLATWLMKGFLDEIPRAFEEAALVDGYTHGEALWRVVLPEARTGIAVTAVFCLISAWNEYGFAMTLNSSGAVTVPAYFAGLQGNIEGMPWPEIAAGALLFVAPIVVFTWLVRGHLLRGITFGTVKQ